MPDSLNEALDMGLNSWRRVCVVQQKRGLVESRRLGRWAERVLAESADLQDGRILFDVQNPSIL